MKIVLFSSKYFLFLKIIPLRENSLNIHKNDHFEVISNGS